MLSGVLSKFISESFLSLYPVFIKLIDFPTGLNVWLRLVVYSAISAAFVNWDKIEFSPVAIALSATMILHVYSSYESYTQLDSGVAYSLFYLYPLFILLFAGELSWKIGVYLLALAIFIYDSTANNPEIQFKGIAWSLISGLTEAIIYFIVKMLGNGNPWNTMFLSYFPAAIAVSLFGWRRTNTQIPVEKIGIAAAINAILGVAGYYLRFYSIEHLSTQTYSAMSFIGILMSYFYGWVFVGEKMNLMKMVGTGLIILTMM